MNNISLLLSRDVVRARDEELLSPITPKSQTPKTPFTWERVGNRRVLNNKRIPHGYNCLCKTSHTRPTYLVEIDRLYRQRPVQARPRPSLTHPEPTINRCETNTRRISQLNCFHAKIWKRNTNNTTALLLLRHDVKAQHEQIVTPAFTRRRESTRWGTAQSHHPKTPNPQNPFHARESG